MNIKEINDKKIWDECVKKNATDGGLLQSFDWGEFQKSYGRKVLRLENGWQAIVMPLPFNLRYLYISRPISDFRFPISDLIKAAKKEKAVFVRVDQADEMGLQKFGFRKVGISVQPEEELWLDLQKSEEEILAGMKQKCRYNIKVAEKNGVIIKSKVQSSKSKVKELFSLIKMTSARQGIRPHPEKYYEKMVEILSANDEAEIWLGEHQGKVLAGALVTYYNKMATYLHGGSSDEEKNVMAPYLLHWEIIRDAKRRGMQIYNFGGVSETKKNWAGITRFKRGFAPQVEFRKYAEVVDYPVNRFWYGVYRVVKNFK